MTSTPENKDKTTSQAIKTKKIVVAVAGNPNSGKTTLFNGLTGSNQHVGNYPGVTVEKKVGHRNYKGFDFTFVDLPGTYSLSAYSLEETIARDFIISERPDIVIDVIDSSNLERNLYLASQILELDVPMIMALNMSDEVQKQGTKIDTKLLSQLLNSPAVETVASHEKGLDELLDTIIETLRNSTTTNVNINYGTEMEDAISQLIPVIQEVEILSRKYPPRWTAIKLLEMDPEIVKLAGDDNIAVLKAHELIRKIKNLAGDDPELLIADSRYGFVNGIYMESVQKIHKSRRDFTEKIDTVLANRVLGLPIFFLMMWATFQLTFTLGAPLMNLMDSGFAMLGRFLTTNLPDGLFQSLLVDGVIGGVGGVLIFLPSILMLFLAISLLEDTGYMARAAFIMDKVMHAIGLHGKSFMPMLIGFGCSVPAIMATRSLEDPKDRLTTMIVIPLMSCGARLPVYILLAGAFFPKHAGNVIFIMYLLGVVLAILVALVLKKFVFHGPGTPFVMELPPYRIPTLKSVLLHMWRRAYFYIRKAGTLILAASILIWVLTSFSPPSTTAQTTHLVIPQADKQAEISQNELDALEAQEKISNSYAGHIGRFIEPVIRPIGFDWKMGIALITGFAAKEVVVSTLATVYAVSDSGDESSSNLSATLLNDPNFSPLVGLCLMIFTLIYIPCIAAVAVLYRESGSAKWTVFTVVYTTTLAWVVTFITYQSGSALGY